MNLTKQSSKASADAVGSICAKLCNIEGAGRKDVLFVCLLWFALVWFGLNRGVGSHNIARTKEVGGAEGKLQWYGARESIHVEVLLQECACLKIGGKKWGGGGKYLCLETPHYSTFYFIMNTPERVEYKHFQNI